MEVITHPNYALPFMQPGRLVRITHQQHEFGWGVVVDFRKRTGLSRAQAAETKQQNLFIIDTLLNVAAGPSSVSSAPGELPPGVYPPKEGDRGRMEVVPVLLSCVQAIGQVRVFLPKELKDSAQRHTVQKAVDEVQRRFPDGIARLDPIEAMKITDDGFHKLIRVCLAQFALGDLQC